MLKFGVKFGVVFRSLSGINMLGEFSIISRVGAGKLFFKFIFCGVVL